MKKALINPIDLIEGYPSVVSVNDTEFPCVPDYYWVSCDNNVMAGMYYKDGMFYSQTVQEQNPVPLPTADDNRKRAVERLKNTDWVEIPSVSDQSVTPHLLNASEFAPFRNHARSIAVNPVEGIIDWPVKPTEQWSN